MVYNYYIIRQVAAELRRRCRGLVFVRAYSAEASELRIEFAGPGGEELLAVKLAPGSPSMFLASHVSEPPKRNVTSFFTELEGKELTEVSVARYDRLVQLTFGDTSLILRFYDRPNAFLLEGNTVVSSFKKSTESQIDFRTDEPFSASKSVQLLGKPLRKEEALCKIPVEEFEHELRNSASLYIYTVGPDMLVSPIKLQQYSGGEVFDSPSAAVERVLAYRHRTQSLEASRRELLQNVDAILEKTANARTEASGSISDTARIDRYTAIGQHILAHAATLEKGAASIALEDGHKAALDPALTPYENANRYFEKARTAKARKADVLKRIASLEQDEEALLNERIRIVEAPGIKELDAIRKSLAAGRFTLQHAADTAIGKTGPQFREYEVAGGMRVLIGKNAKQNDELTLHVAQKEDLWFHARHVSGSHVVLRSGKRPHIPQRAIEQAAELAAYFSDARSQAHAPVAYTRRKYVRKSRGAAPGAVKIEREEVIVVTPQITAKPIS